jgi:hypothetical protein
LKAERGLWLSALTGAVAFLALTGGAILDPTRVDWLLAHPDTATTYLGWAFFRQSPLLQWPYGANPAYGLEIGSSVVYSDSVPLLALALKPFSPLLPAAFQYLGAWLLACFVLQAVFAYRLLRGFSENQILCWIGAAFFLAAPAWLFRLFGHFALFGQWVVLAALCLYFTPRFHPWRWIALLCAAVLIHFYLLVMAGAVWLADAWRRRTARFLFPGLVLIPFVMWAAGYFTIGAAGSALPGFGTYRMNLTAPLDGNGLFSRVVPDIPGAGGDFEGFNYFGIGLLLLAPLALWKRGAFDRKLIPLLTAGLVLTVLALSNRVALGPIELFSYDVPSLLRPYTDLLRGSGRLFWPMYYLALLAILVAVWRGFPSRVAMVVCAVALGLQVVDSSIAFDRIHQQVAAAWRSPLQHPVWQEVAPRYKRVIYVLPPPQSTAYSTFLPWAAFAVQNDMAVNFGYFARVDAERAIEASHALEAAVRANRLDPASLYVFWNDPLWRVASAQRGPEDLVGEIDGYRVIAPGLQGGSGGSPARNGGSAPPDAARR